MHLQSYIHLSPAAIEPFSPFYRLQSHFLSYTHHSQQNLESQNYPPLSSKLLPGTFFVMPYQLLTVLVDSPQTLISIALSAIRLKMMPISSSFANYLNRFGLL
jgi:hypothetical protein